MKVQHVKSTMLLLGSRNWTVTQQHRGSPCVATRDPLRQEIQCKQCYRQTSKECKIVNRHVHIWAGSRPPCVPRCLPAVSCTVENPKLDLLFMACKSSVSIKQAVSWRQCSVLSLIRHGIKTKWTYLDSTGVNWFLLACTHTAVRRRRHVRGCTCNKEQWRSGGKWKQIS